MTINENRRESDSNDNRSTDCEISASPEAMELSIMSEIIMEYEDEQHSIAKDIAAYKA